MYLRAAHAETGIRLLQQFIHDNPLGIFTTAIPSPSKQYPLIQCTHIPWILDVPAEVEEVGQADGEGEPELGTLRGHMARQNPHTKAILEALTTTPSSTSLSHSDQQRKTRDPHVLEEEVMILFNGPAHHYVTPKFYVETKPTTGKVVPTWNYSAAQAYGRARIYYYWSNASGNDPSSPATTEEGNGEAQNAATDAFLTQQVNDLTRYAETEVMEHREKPWEVSDAPDSYVRIMKKNIVGIEVKITRLEGKFKMSQELAKGDRVGVINGFEAMDSDVGHQIAETVQSRGEMKDRKEEEARRLKELEKGT